MIERPLITIITNTKNRCGLISRCIESIQKQTYKNYEHIIADGGDDDTERVVNSYNDPHIRYIKVPTGGPIAQTKKAFEISSGDYVTFLDDDDEYLPEKLEKQLNLILSLSEEYGFIYGSMSYYDNKTGKHISDHLATIEGGIEILPQVVSKPIVSGTPTLLFKRHVFEDIGGTWISGIGNESSDWALTSKALKRGWKVGALKESYLKIYVNHGFQRLSDPLYCMSEAQKYLKFYSYFLNEYKDVFENNPKLSAYHIEGLFSNYMLSKQRFIALRYWIKLLRLRPNAKTFLLLPFKFYKSFY